MPIILGSARLFANKIKMQGTSGLAFFSNDPIKPEFL
jgi:hypothetical protein